MSKTIRMTAAQAMIKWLSVQMTPNGERYIEGMWAIFGHGNVAGIGEALHGTKDSFPTWRGQNEQTMAHAGIAYAKAKKRKRAHAVTASIGPGSTNMVTAAALAYVNRLPVLLVCGDAFASRRPDPVLQQVESFDDGTISANDAFKPVVRYFDRIMRPEHLLTCLPRALSVMTDPANCGPVCLAFCQDVQAEAYDYPEAFFEPKIWHIRRPEPDQRELEQVADLIQGAKDPIIIAGGGVIYAGAEQELGDFAIRHGIPVSETQAGKSALAQSHEMNFGAAGVDGAASANEISESADLVICVGTRLQDFTTGSRTLFKNPNVQFISLNIHGYDAAKHGSVSLVGDAKVTLGLLSAKLGDYKAEQFNLAARAGWLAAVDAHCAAPKDTPAGYLPTDAQVIGAVQRASTEESIAMSAAGTMPGALKLLWQPSQGGYHMEYGYSCMGYEVAGAMGIKLALPEREVICFVGDGSYLMANSELATAVMRKIPFTVVLTDNAGYGCINRLQQVCGGAEFNNMYVDCNIEAQPTIDYVAHASSLGAYAVKAANLAQLETEIVAARSRDIPTVIVIETTAKPGPGPVPNTAPNSSGGGAWWDVSVPQVGGPQRLENARQTYIENVLKQRSVN